MKNIKYIKRHRLCATLFRHIHTPRTMRSGFSFVSWNVDFWRNGGGNVVLVSSTTITATTPAHVAGAVNVVVTNSKGQSGTLTNGYTYTSSGTIMFVR